MESGILVPSLYKSNVPFYGIGPKSVLFFVHFFPFGQSKLFINSLHGLLAIFSNYNMIDTIGSGIKRMFEAQRNRFFPMPDYDFSKRNVQVRISGRIWDSNYTRLLIEKADMDLSTVVLLDRVQKSHSLNEEEIRTLRKLGLIEGRRPNIYIASHVAKITKDETNYIKNKAFDDNYYKKLILSYLETYEQGNKGVFIKLLSDKLSDRLDDKQKRDKIKNLLQALKSEGKIVTLPHKKVWILKEDV